LEGYNVNLYKDKHALGEEFFSIVGGNSFRSSSERVLIIDQLITDLHDRHDGWDNFHHEPPVAAELFSYIPDQKSIFENLAQRLFKTILMCRIGRGVTYCGGVSPSGRPYYDRVLALAGDKFAPHVMASLTEHEIRVKLSRELCRKHARDALAIVRSNVINQRLQECLDYLISNIEKDPSSTSSPEFKKLSAGYINWQ